MDYKKFPFHNINCFRLIVKYYGSKKFASAEKNIKHNKTDFPKAWRGGGMGHLTANYTGLPKFINTITSSKRIFGLYNDH